MENLTENNEFQTRNPHMRLDVASPRLARLPTRVRRFVRPGKSQILCSSRNRKLMVWVVYGRAAANTGPQEWDK